MSKETRIYTVVPKDGQPARLIEASSSAAVVHHCAAGLFDISLSTQKEIVEAMQAGVAVEKAGPRGPGGNPAGEAKGDEPKA